MNRWNGEDVRMERNTFLLFLFLCVLSLAFSREGIAGTLQAVKQGAKLLWGGKSEGLCYYPSVLSRVTEDMEIFHEETFGPVASVVTADTAEEPLRMGNNSQYGLSSGIITNDFRKGLDIAEELESGVCHIDDSSLHDEAHAPLGGMKDSGWGRNGFEAIDEFTELRWVSFQKTRRHYPI